MPRLGAARLSMWRGERLQPKVIRQLRQSLESAVEVDTIEWGDLIPTQPPYMGAAAIGGSGRSGGDMVEYWGILQAPPPPAVEGPADAEDWLLISAPDEARITLKVGDRGSYTATVALTRRAPSTAMHALAAHAVVQGICADEDFPEPLSGGLCNPPHMKRPSLWSSNGRWLWRWV